MEGYPVADQRANSKAHLLANSLGGYGTDARNLVAFSRTVDSEAMNGFEKDILSKIGALGASDTVAYESVPNYPGPNDPVPTSITVKAVGPTFNYTCTFIDDPSVNVGTGTCP